MTKTFKPIKTRKHWWPICFYIVYSKACFSSWPPIFSVGMFLITFPCFFDSLGLGLDSAMTSYSKSSFSGHSMSDLAGR